MSLETLDVKFLNVWKEEAEERGREGREGEMKEGGKCVCPQTRNLEAKCVPVTLV